MPSSCRRDADVPKKPRVMMAALVYAKRDRIYQVDTVSMMLTTDQWIPLDGLYELPLIEALQREQRSFMKPLKYDARSAAAFPNVLLLDCEGGPVPLHVVSAVADAKEKALKVRALAIDPPHWIWNTDTGVPSFPARGRSRLWGQLGKQPSQAPALAPPPCKRP